MLLLTAATAHALLLACPCARATRPHMPAQINARVPLHAHAHARACTQAHAPHPAPCPSACRPPRHRARHPRRRPRVPCLRPPRLQTQMQAPGPVLVHGSGCCCPQSVIHNHKTLLRLDRSTEDDRLKTPVNAGGFSDFILSDNFICGRDVHTWTGGNVTIRRPTLQAWLL